MDYIICLWDEYVIRGCGAHAEVTFGYWYHKPVFLINKLENIAIQIDDTTEAEITDKLNSKEGKIGVVVTFLAILELLKDSLIEIVQSEEFGPIHIKGIEEVH